MDYIDQAEDATDADVKSTYVQLAHDEWIHAKKLNDLLTKMMEASGIKTNPLGLEMWESWSSMIEDELTRVEGCYNKVTRTVKK